jgi:hypothetical protein
VSRDGPGDRVGLKFRPGSEQVLTARIAPVQA